MALEPSAQPDQRPESPALGMLTMKLKPAPADCRKPVFPRSRAHAVQMLVALGLPSAAGSGRRRGNAKLKMFRFGTPGMGISRGALLLADGIDSRRKLALTSMNPQRPRRSPAREFCLGSSNA
jgi:hypothetical protein